MHAQRGGLYVNAGAMGRDYEHPEKGLMCLRRAQTECTQAILTESPQINFKGHIAT